MLARTEYYPDVPARQAGLFTPAALTLSQLQVLETRSELDNLDALAGCALLQLHPERYQAFLQVLVRCPSWLFTLFPTDATTAWGAVAANGTNPPGLPSIPAAGGTDHAGGHHWGGGVPTAPGDGAVWC